MIQIERTPKPPKLTDAVQQELTNEFKKDNSKAVWRKTYIRKALLDMSNSKCCYCECLVGKGTKEMHIDHFQPKSIYPDLVVQWENLLPSCSQCNKSKSDHNTVQEPIINPTKDNPKEYFYLKNYRYVCKDNAPESIARRTLGVLSLNDTTEKVQERFLIGEKLQEKLYEILCLAESNHKTLSTNTVIKNRVRRGCRDILRFGIKTSEFSAFMSTLIHNDENYSALKKILVDHEIWDAELMQLEEDSLKNMFPTSKDG